MEIVGAKKFEQQKQYVQVEVAKQVCGNGRDCWCPVALCSVVCCSWCQQVQSCFEAVLKMPKDSEKNVPKMSLSGFERNTEVEEKVK